MIPLLNAGAIVLAHASEGPHVHPHDTGLALVLALIAGSVLAMLKRRKESQTGATTGAFSTSTSTVIPHERQWLSPERGGYSP